MKENILRFILALTLIVLLSCASTRSTGDKSEEGTTAPRSAVQASAILGTAFGPAREFVGSPYEEIGINGLFDVHPAETCLIAVLPNGDEITNPNKRHHEKMWIIDGETDHGVAVVGGLNIANEYFRIDPQNPSRYWRDQDVIVKGDVIKDMVATFERNFEYHTDQQSRNQRSAQADHRRA